MIFRAMIVPANTTVREAAVPYGPRHETCAGEVDRRGGPGHRDRDCGPGHDPAQEPECDPDRNRDPAPDPFEDVDRLEALEDEITRLAAHIHAANHRLLVLLAEFDRRRGWELGGHRSAAHWLHARTGIHLGAAREKVRTARALTTLPCISGAMARGELSYSKECAPYCTSLRE